MPYNRRPLDIDDIARNRRRIWTLGTVVMLLLMGGGGWLVRMVPGEWLQLAWLGSAVLLIAAMAVVFRWWSKRDGE
ncbi:hypothetical protein [Sphingomicrobium flavum]|uniref:hypothetical protein n=1 Tax=Sphingomicrobium flavum TaxID=1229164 RepID=UPI0021ADEC06|nr:hypothetical protein [Sphingomicrobium flavum]